MIFDSHAHYDDARFDDDRDYLLKEYLPSKGVCGIVNCASNLKSAIFSLELAGKYDYVYAAVGIHPEEIYDAAKLCEIEKLAHNKKAVAIGEIGLDYHYCADTKEQQKELFEAQVMLANKLNLPVIVHDREAHADTLEILKKHRPRGVVHCFSGSVEMARDIINLGMYIGLGGAVTFKNAKMPLKVAEYVPSDRLLNETDCPYMSPVPHRGERNDSSLIDFSAAVMAEVRNEGKEQLLNNCCNNARRLFSIE